jgi:alginate O-acetyltransferase complex protein AlgI
MVLLLVMIGWVFFRADNFSYATDYLTAMFSSRGQEILDSQALSLLSLNWFYFAIAIIVAMPIFPKLQKLELRPSMVIVREVVSMFLYFFLFAQVILYLVNSTYNPFLYFRF